MFQAKKVGDTWYVYCPSTGRYSGPQAAQYVHGAVRLLEGYHRTVVRAGFRSAA